MEAIKDTLALISSTTKKKFNTIQLRELEEVKPNTFICFVDDAENTYDVEIVIDKTNIVTSKCDCKNGSTWCFHKLLALQTIANKTPIKIIKKTTIKSSAKAKPYIELLNNIDVVSLKTWVLAIIEKNKDLELGFVQTFKQQETDFTPAIVREQLDNIIKQTLKRRKTVEANELKKIFELVEAANKPVLTYFSKNITTTNALNCALEILRFCIAFDNTIYTTSNKIGSYTKKTLSTIAIEICTIEVENTFEKILAELLHQCIDNKEKNAALSYTFFDIVVLLIDLSGTKQDIVISTTMKWYENIRKKQIRESLEFEKKLLPALIKAEQFKPYFKLFETQTYVPTHNNLLLKQLIAINELEKAKELIQKCINENSNIKYNIPLFVHLANIAKLSNDKNTLVACLYQTLPFYKNIDDYFLLRDNETDTEKFKKWRSKFILNTTRNYWGHEEKAEAYKFLWEIFINENDLNHMLQHLNEYTELTNLINFFKPLADKHKEKFLLALFKLHYGNSFVQENKNTYTNSIQTLAELIKKYYPSNIWMYLAKKEKESKYNYYKYPILEACLGNKIN
jgi:hypothetical protein